MDLSNLRTKEAVFAEARRVNEHRRWAHMARLFDYANKMFQVQGREFIEETDLGITPQTLYRNRKCLEVLDLVPSALKPHAKMSYCYSIYRLREFKEAGKTERKAIVEDLMKHAIKTQVYQHRIDVYLSAVGAMRNILRDDPRAVEGLAPEMIARRYVEAQELAAQLEVAVGKYWKWHPRAHKFVPKKAHAS